MEEWVELNGGMEGIGWRDGRNWMKGWDVFDEGIG